METFKLKSTYVNSKYIRFLYPLMIFALSIFIMTTPFIEFSEFAPLIIIGTVAWAVYDFYKIKKMKKFFVTLNDDEININDTSILKWKDITSVKYYSFGFGMQPIVVLNELAKIPAVIENLELLKNRIQKNIPEDCNIINK